MTIKQKQALLFYLGYYVGNIDGDWGTLSKTATKTFQKDFGLTADGVCILKRNHALARLAFAVIAAGVTKQTSADQNILFHFYPLIFFQYSAAACSFLFAPGR